MSRSTKCCVPLFALLLSTVVFSIGCDTPEKSEGGANAGAKADAGHSHDDGHDHDHPAHGPNGGHIIALETEDFQAEWKKYKDNNITRIYLLDADGKTAKPMKLDSLVIMPQAGNDDTVKFELVAEEPNEEGAAAVYMLDDEQLKIAIPLGVNLEFKMGDQSVLGEIKAHEPLDH